MKDIQIEIAEKRTFIAVTLKLKNEQIANIVSKILKTKPENVKITDGASENVLMISVNVPPNPNKVMFSDLCMLQDLLKCTILGFSGSCEGLTINILANRHLTLRYEAGTEEEDAYMSHLKLLEDLAGEGEW